MVSLSFKENIYLGSDLLRLVASQSLCVTNLLLSKKKLIFSWDKPVEKYLKTKYVVECVKMYM